MNTETSQESKKTVFETADWLAAQEALRFDNLPPRRDSEQVMLDLAYLADNGNETAAMLLGETAKNSPWLAEEAVAINGLGRLVDPTFSEDSASRIDSIIASVSDAVSEQEALSAMAELEEKAARMVGFNLLSQQLKQHSR